MTLHASHQKSDSKRPTSSAAKLLVSSTLDANRKQLVRSARKHKSQPTRTRTETARTACLPGTEHQSPGGRGRSQPHVHYSMTCAISRCPAACETYYEYVLVTVSSCLSKQLRVESRAAASFETKPHMSHSKRKTRETAPKKLGPAPWPTRCSQWPWLFQRLAGALVLLPYQNY